MSSDSMTIRTAQVGAGHPWLQTLHEWVTTVDHKRLGILYVLLALLFLIIGGIEAIIIRIQLIVHITTLFLRKSSIACSPCMARL